MGKLGVGLALALSLTSTVLAFDSSHNLWKQVLDKYRTQAGGVAYGPLKADTEKDSAHPLSAYLKSLSEVSYQMFSSWDRNAQMAFLINAYNAFTVRWIVDHYPVSSIKKTVGWFASPWKQEFFSLLEGKITHLDAIEHDWLRKKYEDARIHAAVNCASISCPILQATPFTAKNLDAQLEGAFRAFLQDPSRNRYEPDSGVLNVSKIFDWFESDFEKSYGSVKNTIERFGPPGAQRALNKKGTLRYLDYDWGLNDSAAPPAALSRKR
ncbi:MAG: DUF547 domain-containing protein [Bdellovibrionales bacterium]|nr:DUF547 domain-containing protein [Bdellovibrionales bacterium]